MQTTQPSSKKNKVKLDFKDSKYATGRRKTSIAKVWIKKVQVKFMLIENCYRLFFKRQHYCWLQDPLG